MNKKKTFAEFFPLMEMLNTKMYIENEQSFSNKIDIFGNVDDIKLKITLEAFSFQKLNGVNLSFEVWNGERYSEKYGTIKTEKAAKIIGAVKNALVDKVAEYEWDFLLIIAKDEIETRMRLYERIIRLLGHQIHIDVIEGGYQGSKFIGVSDKLSVNEMQQMLKQLSES